jgi:hypothetical protein
MESDLTILLAVIRAFCAEDTRLATRGLPKYAFDEVASTNAVADLGGFTTATFCRVCRPMCEADHACYRGPRRENSRIFHRSNLISAGVDAIYVGGFYGRALAGGDFER